MGRIIADLHVHSGYSRATSKDMTVRTMARMVSVSKIMVLPHGYYIRGLVNTNINIGVAQIFLNKYYLCIYKKCLYIGLSTAYRSDR